MKLIGGVEMGTYKEFHQRSIEQPDAFWGEQAQLIDWHKPPQQICDYSKPPFVKWFVGGETNLCHNAVDRHAATASERPGADLHLDRDQRRKDLHLRRTEERSDAHGGDHAEPGRRQGRPRADLHADDRRSHLRHAGLRPHRRHPLGGVRRLRLGLAGHAHRRRQAEADRLLRRRHARRQGRALQASARRGHASWPSSRRKRC